MRTLLLMAVMFAGLSGVEVCSAQSRPSKRVRAKGASATPKESMATPRSLWERGERKRLGIRTPVPRDPISKNDIILVVVTEVANATNDSRLDTRRKLEVDALLDKFVRFSGVTLKPDFSPQPEVEVEFNRKLQANGTTDRNEAIRLRVAARVVDIRDNGNLVLEARRERRINDEKSLVVLTGEVREADVDSEFAIPSDRVADMKLAYHGSGPVSRNSGTTWLTWIIDHVWPF